MTPQTPRIAPIEAPYNEQAQALFDRLPKQWGPPFTVFRVLARDPRLLQRYMSGSVAYLEPNHISVRQREVFLLRVTALCGCEYEWGLRAHFFPEAASLSETDLRATVTGSLDHVEWGADERLLLRLAQSLHDTCGIDEALWTELAAVFSAEAILQLLMLAGYYRTMAYLANGLHLPLEPGLARPFPD